MFLGPPVNKVPQVIHPLVFHPWIISIRSTFYWDNNNMPRDHFRIELMGCRGREVEVLTTKMKKSASFYICNNLIHCDLSLYLLLINSRPSPYLSRTHAQRSCRLPANLSSFTVPVGWRWCCNVHGSSQSPAHLEIQSCDVFNAPEISHGPSSSSAFPSPSATFRTAAAVGRISTIRLDTGTSSTQSKRRSWTARI